MDTRLHHVNCQLSLKSIWHTDTPEILVTFNNNILYSGRLSCDMQLGIDEHLPSGNYDLSVEFTNKTDSDIVDNLDKAVVIESVELNNITSPKFVWAGVYEPQYPEPWATQQRDQGIVLESCLKSQTYLGWNGKWTLTFSVPVFTWIHRIENLGWIYD